MDEPGKLVLKELCDLMKTILLPTQHGSLQVLTTSLRPSALSVLISQVKVVQKREGLGLLMSSEVRTEDLLPYSYSK